MKEETGGRAGVKTGPAVGDRLKLRKSHPCGGTEFEVVRTGMDIRFNEKVFETLEVPLENPLAKIDAYIDSSSVELFINDGEKTFASRIFPTEGEHGFTASANAAVKVTALKKSVTDKFIV
jgi:sucrose-6-phosphate hydrolase SacC (GH32 family)